MKKIAMILLLALVCAIPATATDYGFGGDTINATTAVGMNDSSLWVDTITTPANSGNLDSAVFWMNWNVGGPDSVNIAIYAEDSSFVDSTEKVAIVDANRTRYKADFVLGASLNASTEYFVAIHTSSEGTGAGSKWYYYSAGTVITSRYDLDGVGQVPTTLTGTTADGNNRDKAIWVFYSDGGGPPPTTEGRRRRILR